MTAQTRPPSNAPDPLGLAKAREMQERRRPAEVILQGSRAIATTATTPALPSCLSAQTWPQYKSG